MLLSLRKAASIHLYDSERMRSLKKIIIGVLALLMLLSLAACGKKEYTVDYVKLNISIGSSSAGTSVSFVGQYGNEEKVIDAESAFKDCTLESYSFNNGSGGKFQMSGDGKNAIDGGVTLTLKDADGNTHKVPVDEGSKFEVDDSNDRIKLILPEDQ